MQDEMWMVVAIIQPFKLETVTLALARVAGFGGMTVSDCRGFGRAKLATDAATAGESVSDQPRRRSSDEELVDFTSKIRIEIVVATRAVADAVVEAVVQTAQTGRGGDGKLFAWPIRRAVRIRTKQEDAAAL